MATIEEIRAALARTSEDRYGMYDFGPCGCTVDDALWFGESREYARALLAEVARLTALNATEREARHGLWHDLADFAKTVHETHHAAHSGTWLSCDRGTCPGLQRALVRGSDDALRAGSLREVGDGN